MRNRPNQRPKPSFEQAEIPPEVPAIGGAPSTARTCDLQVRNLRQTLGISQGQGFAERKQAQTGAARRTQTAHSRGDLGAALARVPGVDPSERLE